MGEMKAAVSRDDYGEGLKARDAQRIDVGVLVSLRPDGLRNISVRICDISATGFMATCDEPIALGSYISIDLPGLGPTHARIRWSVGGRIGGRFLEPIDLPFCHAQMLRQVAAT